MLDQSAKLIRRDQTTTQAKDDFTRGENLLGKESLPSMAESLTTTWGWTQRVSGGVSAI